MVIFSAQSNYQLFFSPHSVTLTSSTSLTSHTSNGVWFHSCDIYTRVHFMSNIYQNRAAHSSQSRDIFHNHKEVVFPDLQNNLFLLFEIKQDVCLSKQCRGFVQRWKQPYTQKNFNTFLLCIYLFIKIYLVYYVFWLLQHCTNSLQCLERQMDTDNILHIDILFIVFLFIF